MDIGNWDAASGATLIAKVGDEPSRDSERIRGNHAWIWLRDDAGFRIKLGAVARDPAHGYEREVTVEARELGALEDEAVAAASAVTAGDPVNHDALLETIRRAVHDAREWISG